MIKMIVTDMDGTLLNSDNKISDNTIEYLKRIQGEGIKLVMASGRSYSRLRKYYELLDMPKYSSMLIEVNGLYINNLIDNTRIQFETMKKEDTKKILETINSEMEILAYFDRGITYYVPESMLKFKYDEIKERNLPQDTPLTCGMTSWIEDMRDGYPEQNRVLNIEDLPNEFNKLSLANDESITKEVYDILKNKLNDEYEFAQSSPRIIEINKKGVTKGNALKVIMRDYNIKEDEVLVFGDAGNDLSMFGCVKYCIAMGNASEELKAVAYDVTDTNDNEGLYKACTKYIS